MSTKNFNMNLPGISGTIEPTKENYEAIKESMIQGRRRFLSGRWKVPASWCGKVFHPTILPHVSHTQPGLLAGFTTRTSMVRKIPITLGPGPILQKSFPQLRSEEISALILADREFETGVATSREDIRKIYQNRSVTTCMSGYFSNVHPCEIYADSNGFGVFYAMDNGKLQGRAVVDRRSKVYWRAYGNGMEEILHKHGYKSGRPRLPITLTLLSRGYVQEYKAGGRTIARAPDIHVPHFDFHIQNIQSTISSDRKTITWELNERKRGQLYLDFLCQLRGVCGLCGRTDHMLYWDANSCTAYCQSHYPPSARRISAKHMRANKASPLGIFV